MYQNLLIIILLLQAGIIILFISLKRLLKENNQFLKMNYLIWKQLEQALLKEKKK